MRKFNPDRELYKIKYGKRNKIILSIFLLLVVISIGSTYALYQVRHSKRIIYTTVSDFSGDIRLAVYVDGVKQNNFPDKNSNIVYTEIKCDKGNVNASWDYNDWSLIIESKLPNKCSVYFETRYKDKSGASYPELYQGLIPVYFDNKEIKIANLQQEWYNYDNHNWANAILIDKAKKDKFYNSDGTLKTGTIVSESDILQMYVWIPRYRYKLWNVLNESSDPFAIEIEFESNTVGRSIGTNNGDWYTHPAFLFGDTELNGIWVGKFEPSDPGDPIGREVNKITEITILPNKTSMVNKNLVTIFNKIRTIEKEGNKYNLDSNEVDTHIMKNMEWGAVAYLSSSKYGIYSSDKNSCMIDGMSKEECEVWINNTVQGREEVESQYFRGGTYTGCAGESVNASVIWNTKDGAVATCAADKVWNQSGINASTTGNMYGIYDMSGGAWEFVMGGMAASIGSTTPYYNTQYSGFSSANMPEAKYFDLYEFSTTATLDRGRLGDDTREVRKLLSDGRIRSWNGGATGLPYVTSTYAYPYMLRGGRYDIKEMAGVHAMTLTAGREDSDLSFRVILTAQDGNE